MIIYGVEGRISKSLEKLERNKIERIVGEIAGELEQQELEHIIKSTSYD